MGRLTIKPLHTLSNLKTEGLVSCGKQLGFGAKKKPGHRPKAGVSLRPGRWEGLPLLWRKEES